MPRARHRTCASRRQPGGGGWVISGQVLGPEFHARCGWPARVSTSAHHSMTGRVPLRALARRAAGSSCWSHGLQVELPALDIAGGMTPSAPDDAVLSRHAGARRRRSTAAAVARIARRRGRLGWALKAACYETWNTAPARAERAAELLHDLAAARQSHSPVLHALACWTRGIAELGAGRMAAALDALDAAANAFEALGDGAHAAQTQVPS